MKRHGLSVEYVLAAARDVREQSGYYSAKAPGLEKRFIAALTECERFVVSNPEGLPRIDDSTDIRSAVLRRFPFRLLYVVRGDVVLVLAVAHTAREPSQFLERSRPDPRS